MDSYDVFISFKNKDASGNDTFDQKLAFSLYRELTSLGVSVFFCNSTLMSLGESAFKEAINYALDTACMLVVIGTSTENVTSPWVKYEWSSFHDDILSGRKENAAILTYVSGMSPGLLPRELRNYESLLWEEKTPSEAADFVRNYLSRLGKGSAEQPATTPIASQVPRDFSYTPRSKQVEFSPLEKESKARLKKLESFTEIRENEILDRAVSLIGRDGLVVLDYGCAKGDTAYSRFANRPEVSKIICVDLNAEAVEEGKRECKSEKMSFYCISDGNDPTGELRDILENEGVSSFDLIFMATVLQFADRPAALIRNLHRVLSSGGCLYSRSAEDSSKIAYPDEREVLRQILERYENGFNSMDGHMGKKQFDLFRKAGLKNIEVHALPQDTDDLDYWGKLDLFDVHFGWRISGFEKMHRNNPSDTDFANDYQWMKAALDVLEDMFADDSFWYGYTDFACFGFARG